MTPTIGHFIDGRHGLGSASRTAAVHDPATGAQTGAQTGPGEVEAAVARTAFPAWAATPPLRRTRILNRFLRLIDERVDRLAAVTTAEHAMG